MPTLSLAPLQGLTDFHFRNAFFDYFNGLDLAYSPYIRLDKKGSFKNKHLSDVLIDNNKKINLIPQILTNNADEFIYLANYLYDLGYDTMNLNMGCPYPMVAKRNLGSGMLSSPDMVVDLLDKVLAIIKNKVSLKMRIGYVDKGEIFDLLPRLNQFPLSEIIIHPRTAKQMYKGAVHTDIFEECIASTKHIVVYNGDINSKKDFDNLSNRFSSIDSWMLGRGVIANPFLPAQIKNSISDTVDKKSVFSDFHSVLFAQNGSTLSGGAHLLRKMLDYWSYFSQSFSNSKRVFKQIKKSKSVEDYHGTVRAILCNEEWIA